MKFTRSLRCFVFSLLAFAGSFSGDAQAAGLVISFSQSGADIEVTTSGTVDLTGLTQSGDIGGGASKIGNNPTHGEWIYFGVVAGDDYYTIPVVTGIFSSDTFEYSGGASGDRFALLSLLSGDTYLYFADGFSGGEVNSSLIIPNVELSALGLESFSYSWGPGPNQSLAVIPEPATVMLSALGLFSLVGRRRRS